MKKPHERRLREIDSETALKRLGNNWSHSVIQGLNLSSFDFTDVQCDNTVFLGCEFPTSMAPCELYDRGAIVFPALDHLPYKPYRGSLYTRDELMQGWSPEDDQSKDLEIYNHFSELGRNNPSVMEALAMRLHDHAIDDALSDLLEGRIDNDGKKKVVGIMGGHSTPRTDPYYEKVALIAQQLTRAGYFIATGGGPGMMEAGNLGAYFAQYSQEELLSAIDKLKTAPTYKDKGFNDVALEVINDFPAGSSTLAIPTWFYGHEPSNLFSQHIAKYFSNSLREDGLLAISVHGVIFAPGSAGTTQEVFMDGTQNHYLTFEKVSPMVFLGEDHFSTKTLVYDCLKRQSAGKKYDDYIYLSDEVHKVCEFIESHPPS